MDKTYDNDIEKLNSLLRGELAAVETYTQCIEKMDASDTVVVAQLRTLARSHQHRADRLTMKVRELGGDPETGSGAWGTFAKLVEGGAKLFGKAAAISALEEGEDHGKKEYDDLDDLTLTTKAFVQRELMPEQQRTHDVLNRLQHQM